MNRRTLVLGLGTIATGSAAAVGSGAFSSVEADRSVTVEVADDTEAFLALIPTSEYAIERNGLLTLDLSPSNPTNAGGTGVNANAETIIRDVFEIENRGTQTVEIDFEGGEDDSVFGSITLSTVEDDLTVNIAPSDNPTLDPGESVSYNLSTVFAGEGARPETRIDGTITIVAEATGE